MKNDLQRTTIFLTKDQHDKLRTLAFKKRKSMAQLIREAVLEILEDEEDLKTTSGKVR
jgi:predicted DNA-binding protein